MCNCIQKVNNAFEGHPQMGNTILDSAFSFGSGDEPLSRLIIATRKRDTKDRRKAKLVFPSFCPFCGERISSHDEKTPDPEADAEQAKEAMLEDR